MGLTMREVDFEGWIWEEELEVLKLEHIALRKIIYEFSFGTNNINNVTFQQSLSLVLVWQYQWLFSYLNLPN